MPDSEVGSDTSSCYIPRFPTEVTEVILSKCDGATLLEAKAGDNICARIIDTRINWQQRCMSEIPECLREELLLQMYPKYWFTDNVNWPTVFETWVKWNKFFTNLGKSSEVQRMEEPPYSINCVEVSGDVAFVGHAQGVQSYNLTSGESTVIFHGIAVDSMELFTQPGAPTHDNEILKGCLHDKLDLYLKPRFHNVIDLRKRYHHSRSYNPVREKVLTKYCKNATLHLKESEYNNYFPSGDLILLSGEDVYSVPSDCDNSKGICLYNNTISYFVKSSPLVMAALNFKLERVSSCCSADMKSRPIDCACGCLRAMAFKLKTWKCGMFFAISMCNRLYMNLRNSSIYVYLKEKVITSIELFQNFLILGTDVGYLFLYQIQKLEDLLQFDFNSPIHRIDVDDSAIIAIRSYQKNCTPGLAVATRSCLYRITANV
ncbi:unnamed protein product [Bemisia tabaci]|uniref:Uncharacterized protein n=1 Tax=Bemisia tabaci TaxID=7038 RepID=A0A9P0AAC8_BEMTA|nr:unnamed protein product [Bemisia tabaci]